MKPLPRGLAVLAWFAIVSGVLTVLCAPVGMSAADVGKLNGMLEAVDLPPLRFPWWAQAGLVASQVLTIVCSVAMLVGGVGTLRRRSWARSVMNGQGAAGLVNALLTVGVLHPVLDDFLARSPLEFPAGTMPLFLLLVAVLLGTFPLLCLFAFNTPGAKAALPTVSEPAA